MRDILLGMATPKSPTVKRRRVARELRVLRERAGLTLVAAAKNLDMTGPNLGKIENRQVTAKPVFVRAALALYGVTGDDAEYLIEMARGAQGRGWWQDYDQVAPEWFSFYIGLEEDAGRIETYESESIPGLFQTAEVARAISRTTAGDENVDQKVELRMRRQGILTREEPTEVSAVINEAVLLRPVGGPKVFRAQLEHLADLADLPNVTIQVLPFSAGEHPAFPGPYVILTFEDAVDKPVVYLENYTFGQVLEEEKHFKAYKSAHQTLMKMALTPKQSLARIRELAGTIK